MTTTTTVRTALPAPKTGITTGTIYVLLRGDWTGDEPTALTDEGWFATLAPAQARSDELNGMTQAGYRTYLADRQAVHDRQVAERVVWEKCRDAGIELITPEPHVLELRKPDSFKSWKIDRRRIISQLVYPEPVQPAAHS